MRRTRPRVYAWRAVCTLQCVDTLSRDVYSFLQAERPPCILTGASCNSNGFIPVSSFKNTGTGNALSCHWAMDFTARQIGVAYSDDDENNNDKTGIKPKGGQRKSKHYVSEYAVNREYGWTLDSTSGLLQQPAVNAFLSWPLLISCAKSVTTYDSQSESRAPAAGCCLCLPRCPTCCC